MDILRKRYTENAIKGEQESEENMESEMVEEDSDHRYQAVHTPVPVRASRPPENTTSESEQNSIRRLLMANLLQQQSRLWRHKSLDFGILDSIKMDKLPAISGNMFADGSLASQWQMAIEHTSMAVVTVRFCQAAPFDTTGAIATEASGFVVDKQRGIILTNRHVACAGPFVGEAVFQNREEIDVYAIYRDPIHDFGFLKYSPDAVKYYDVHEIQLSPGKIRVGTDIRIIGNDSGEELSIMAGQVSRIDRNAPDYGPMTYNDFNTFYLQAAASSSGGSSGSPVVDIHGCAVGLQAAGRNQSAIDFFLPLDRVKRALELIQADMPVSRGDIQVQFLYKPFDYARNIGLSQSTEERIRAHNEKGVGVLVAETVLPDGPGDRAGMIAGDVLVSINGRIVTSFVDLDDIFDSSVGQDIQLLVERDGKSLELEACIEDIHLVTPDQYLEIGGAVLHDLSYQLARYYCVPVQGVYVERAWGMLPLEDAGEGVIIESVDGCPTPSLEIFIEMIRNIADRARFPVVYYSLNDINEMHVHIVENERHWTDMNLYTRNDGTGIWDRLTIELPQSSCELEPQTTQFSISDNPVMRSIMSSLVQVHFYIPWMVNGFPVNRRTGTGLIVDATRGLVVISRSIVPFELGDLSLTVAESVTIPAKVVYLHPTLNFAIAQYDPYLLGDTPVVSASISTSLVVEGDSLVLHTYNNGKGLASVRTTVTTVEPMSIPKHSPPRFRSINADWLKLDTRAAQKYNTGFLTDMNGSVVRGMWVSYVDDADEDETNNEYFYGIDASKLIPILKQFLETGLPPQLCVLGVELTTISLVEARHLGLDKEWVDRVRNSSSRHRQMLMINRVNCESKCSGILKPLDVLLCISGQIVTQYVDVDRVVHGAASLNLTVLQNKKIVDVTVETDVDEGIDTQRIVHWAGAIVHEPHMAVCQQCRGLPSKTYVSYNTYGSPAYTAGLAPTSFITHVGDIETPDLDAFLDAVRNLDPADDSHIYVRLIGIDMIPEVVSVKLNAHYWPTAELVRSSTEPSGWKRICYSYNS
ncbi:trypsin-like cysteine/serine peptidase domain-containing protein [Coemansia spiralis]|nr:trypsin-like cysteine/serine peptidase domain-containing protein [Coemansia spiralis]